MFQRKRRKQGKGKVSLVFLGARIVEGKRLYAYGNISGLPNAGLPLDEDKLKVHYYEKPVDYSSAGAIFEFDSERDEKGRLQIDLSTKQWRGSWNCVDQMAEWQAQDYAAKDAWRTLSKKTAPTAYDYDVIRAKLDPVRTVYNKLSPNERVHLLARIINFITREDLGPKGV